MARARIRIRAFSGYWIAKGANALNNIGVAGAMGFGVGIYGTTTLEPVVYNDIGLAGAAGFGVGAYGTTMPEPVTYNDIGIQGTAGFGVGAYGTTTVTES